VIQAFIGALVTLAVAIPASVIVARRIMARSHEAADRARKAERMAHVGQLAGGLAHEIKNPLSTLSINLQLLDEEWGSVDTPEGRRLRAKIEVLMAEVHRLEEILSDFLRFARGPELTPKDCDPNQVVSEVLDFIGPEAQLNHIQVRQSLAPDVPRCRLDVDLIKQALLNIIINAQQAMPEGGELMVRTSAANGQVAIDITDTGPGIPEDQIEQVFHIYFSTKKGGTGLGLPTAKRIVEDHDGEMLLQSEVGKGTNCQIRLPVPTSDPVPPEPPPTEAEPAAG